MDGVLVSGETTEKKKKTNDMSRSDATDHHGLIDAVGSDDIRP